MENSNLLLTWVKCRFLYVKLYNKNEKYLKNLNIEEFIVRISPWGIDGICLDVLRITAGTNFLSFCKLLSFSWIINFLMSNDFSIKLVIFNVYSCCFMSKQTISNLCFFFYKIFFCTQRASFIHNIQNDGKNTGNGVVRLPRFYNHNFYSFEEYYNVH